MIAHKYQRLADFIINICMTYSAKSDSIFLIGAKVHIKLMTEKQNSGEKTDAFYLVYVGDKLHYDQEYKQYTFFNVTEVSS